jgi:hypothetical protein
VTFCLLRRDGSVVFVQAFNERFDVQAATYRAAGW